MNTYAVGIRDPTGPFGLILTARVNTEFFAFQKPMYNKHLVHAYDTEDDGR
jgi:hypothetical protein